MLNDALANDAFAARTGILDVLLVERGDIVEDDVPAHDAPPFARLVVQRRDECSEVMIIARVVDTNIRHHLLRRRDHRGRHENVRTRSQDVTRHQQKTTRVLDEPRRCDGHGCVCAVGVDTTKKRRRRSVALEVCGQDQRGVPSEASRHVERRQRRRDLAVGRTVNKQLDARRRESIPRSSRDVGGV